MKAQIRNIIIAVVVLVLLVGVVLFLTLSQPSQEEESSPSVAALSYPLWNKLTGDIETISVDNELTNYVIQRLDEETLEVAGFEGLPRYELAYSSVTNIASVTAVELVEEEPADYSQYGLQPALTTITVTFADGDTKTLLVGREAPASTQTYVQVEGEPEIYLVNNSTINTYMRDRTHFLSTNVIPTSNDPDSSVVNGIIYGGTVREGSPIVIEPDSGASHLAYSSGYMITSPVDIGLHYNVVEEVTGAALSLTAVSIVEIRPDEAALEAYGLLDPYSTMEVTYNTTVIEGEASKEVPGAHTVLLGNKNEDGNYYAMRQGVDIIYEVAAASVPWVEYEYRDIAQTMLFTPMINDVSRIEVFTQDGEYVFVLDQIPVETDDEDAEPTTELQVSYEGEAVDVSNFRKLYQVFIGAIGENPAEAVPEGESVLRYVFHYHDEDRPEDVVEFHEVDIRVIAMGINGQFHYTLRSSYVDKVLDSVQTLISGEAITSVDY